MLQLRKRNEWMHAFVKHRWFRLAVFIVVLLSLFPMFWQPASDTAGATVMDVCEWVFLALFVLEIVLKCIGRRCVSHCVCLCVHSSGVCVVDAI